MTNARLLLGIDLGTSAVKVAAVDDGAARGGAASAGQASAGAVVAEGSADFSTDSALPHQAEQSPADWLEATRRAMQALDETLRSRERDWPSRVGAIGLTGQLPTLVCLGDQGTIGPAVTWKDGRADSWAASRLEGQRGRHYARTGMPIDGRYLAPMFQFHFAGRAGEVRTVLSAKDYLLHALTGLALTEPSTAAGYGVYDLNEQRFASDLCAFWNLPERVLPQVRPANALAGAVSRPGAELLGLPEGIPVSTGAADSVSASFAMAGLDERVISISFGSSAVILGASAAPRLDPAARYLVTPHVEAPWYGREMDLLASGTGYRWLSSLFGWAEGDIDAQAARSSPGASGLFFPPYLAGGEQGALWNPRLRGALFGLSLGHSRADIARAYLEGVFFEVKRCVEVLAETTPIESVRVGGKIVHSASSMQMLADILGVPVSEAAERSPAAVGAAWQAARLVGGNPTTLRRAARSGRTVAPVARSADAYRAIYAEYLVRAARCE
jgi:xylulokinase